MLKVEHKDLEEVTKFLDTIKFLSHRDKPNKTKLKAQQLSKMIKDKYTEIKPDYDKN
jgi:Cft2 family RNA processing exonuclease